MLVVTPRQPRRVTSQSAATALTWDPWFSLLTGSGTGAQVVMPRSERPYMVTMLWARRVASCEQAH